MVDFKVLPKAEKIHQEECTHLFLQTSHQLVLGISICKSRNNLEKLEGYKISILQAVLTVNVNFQITGFSRSTFFQGRH